jgi:hypothetical protein
MNPINQNHRDAKARSYRNALAESLLNFPSAAQCLYGLLVFLFSSSSALAYPEFQVFAAKTSGRTVNCAMCHTNADGPEGTAPGQIGHLTPAELDRLGHARAALQPGQNVDSPILNAFGNHIIKSLGKEKFVELKVSPANLADVLPPDSDLDHDGIPDIREYLDGTLPVNHNDGNPLLLFKHNFRKNFTSIILTLAATISGIWGLSHLLHGFATASKIKED